MSRLIYIAKAKKPNCSLLKIGVSIDPVGRMKSVHSPDGAGAELLRVIKPSGFWRTVEMRAHERIAHRHVWREWFDVSLNEALWSVMSANKDHDRWSRWVDTLRRDREPLSLTGIFDRKVLIEIPSRKPYWKTVSVGEPNYFGRHY